jgi:hypothetical protein
LTFAIAGISARFIEKPFRQRANDIREERPSRVFRFAGAAMAFLSIIGVILVSNHGFESRFPPDVDKLASYVQYSAPAGFRSGTCFMEPTQPGGSYKEFDARRCLARDVHRQNYLLLGDSHAADLWIGLSRVYPDINFMQATVAGCKPLLNPPSEFSGKVSETCRRIMQFVFRDFLRRNRLDGVIISARWTESNVAGLTETVRYLSAYEPNVFVIGPSVEYSQPLPRILAMSKLHRDPMLAKEDRVIALFALDDQMRSALTNVDAKYISMIRTLCRKNDCETVTDKGVPLQFDYGHLTADGARQVAEVWKASGDFESVHVSRRRGRVLKRRR